MNLPNILTFSRIAMIPLFLLVFFMPFQWAYMASAIIFAVAAVTDWLDGFLARRWDQSTPLGAFLDPVADKLMVAGALAVLIHDYGSLFLTIPAIVIIGREIVISALREWMAEMGKRASVAVSLVGKIKTGFQMVAIVMLLAYPPGEPVAMAGLVMLAVAAALTLWSMCVYLKAAWEEINAT